ncbi:helix-turn-helix domain-containing protein [Cupriavidus basilensis]|uniref:helix-turn-helix domain-containing protein n=1 Tax=Cupriavidus TaxID=106589 RepID=UPI00157ACC39|nr:helix-turn-helix transcriptional regulator [Cupriavidus basilensis]NUA30999.1 helix-turn-helix transcriptional regulator [Cupriavidus basilensis]
MASFYDQLQARRATRKSSLGEVARLIGMAPSNLTTALSGRSDVRASTLEAVGAALDAEWVLVPREHLLAVKRLVEGKDSGPDREAKTSVEMFLEQES